MAAVPIPNVLTAQDKSKLFMFADLVTSPQPPQRQLYFLEPYSLSRARHAGFNDAAAAYQAYLAGNTTETQGLGLVSVEIQQGQPARCTQGNAATLAAIWDETPQKFAPTPQVAEAFKTQGSGAAGMLDIPMVMFEKSRLGMLPITYMNVEERTRNANIPQDFTSYMPSQTQWSRNDHPPVAAILEPLRDYGVEVPPLKDGNNNPVNGPNGRVLRDFSHVLPERICTDISKDGHILAWWWLSDPRITVLDIIDRFYCPTPQTSVKGIKNKIRQQQSRWRTANNTMAMHGAGMQARTDGRAVVGLSNWQLTYNTSWEPDASGRFVKFPGRPVDPDTVWYGLPYLHPSSPLLTGNPNAGAYSTRVTRALAPWHVAPVGPAPPPPRAVRPMLGYGLGANDLAMDSNDAQAAQNPQDFDSDASFSTMRALDASPSTPRTAEDNEASWQRSSAGSNTTSQYPDPTTLDKERQASIERPFNV